MLVEWLVAAAVPVGFFALMPRLLRRSKAASRKLSGGSGVTVAIGLVLSMIFDPKAVQATEQIRKLKDIGDKEEGESGEGLP